MQIVEYEGNAHLITWFRLRLYDSVWDILFYFIMEACFFGLKDDNFGFVEDLILLEGMIVLPSDCCLKIFRAYDTSIVLCCISLHLQVVCSCLPVDSFIICHG